MLDNLQDVLHLIQMAETNCLVLEAYCKGTEVLKALNDGMVIAAEETVDELHEMMQESERVGEVLGESGDYDELKTELEAFLSSPDDNPVDLLASNCQQALTIYANFLPIMLCVCVYCVYSSLQHASVFNSVEKKKNAHCIATVQIVYPARELVKYKAQGSGSAVYEKWCKTNSTIVLTSFLPILYLLGDLGRVDSAKT